MQGSTKKMPEMSNWCFLFYQKMWKMKLKDYLMRVRNENCHSFNWKYFEKSEILRPGPFAPPGKSLPMRNITARSYSCTTCAIFVIFEYSWGPFAFSINISVKAPLSRTHLEADEEREWNSDEEHAPESSSELRADKEKDGRGGTMRARGGRSHRSPCWPCLLQK